MKKTSLFLLSVMTLFTGRIMAQQHCITDEMHQKNVAEHPEIADQERKLNESIRKHLSHLDVSSLVKKKTTTGTEIIDIPVVVHVMHSYGSADYLTDDAIYGLIKRMNNTYSLNYDTSVVIAPFKKYVGKADIRFHLATKDPLGNPTKGITRHFTYLTFGGDDQAKLDQWSPTNYYNIWFENVIGMGTAGGTVLAYAQFPTDLASRPYSDGVICAAPYLNDGSTIEHETGHHFGLYHPWNDNGTGVGMLPCGDDDVDDTPPTIGHFGGCPLYDTECATNYFKIYPNVFGTDSIANYPDTTNAQNIMDYACEVMFTKGQVERMRTFLDSASGGIRASLHSVFNLSVTGALAPVPDLAPIPDFYCTYSAASRMQYFTCPGTTIRFTNKSWQDTVSKVRMVFSNGATIHTDTTMNNPSFSAYVDNAFTEPGWVDIKMTATGNHTGDNTVDFPHSVFVADAVATPASNAIGEFDPAVDLDKWPTFNYYNNEFKWQPANVGYYDNHCMMYKGFDDRVNPSLGLYPVNGTPKGDYDDMFSIPVDLSALASGPCNLNFLYSAASRSSSTLDITDTLIISYSTDKGKIWTNFATLSKSTLENKGALSIPYSPLYWGDWSAKTISIPAAARTAYTVIRFRYKPGVDHFGYNLSTGNNFYIDRVNFSASPASVSSVKTEGTDIVVAPNPTNNNAFVIVKDADNTTANVIVSDIAGKVVYTTSQQISGMEARIEIPESALAAKGIYMVQTTTGNQTKTQKLVVY